MQDDSATPLYRRHYHQQQQQPQLLNVLYVYSQWLLLADVVNWQPAAMLLPAPWYAAPGLTNSPEFLLLLRMLLPPDRRPSSPCCGGQSVPASCSARVARRGRGTGFKRREIESRPIRICLGAGRGGAGSGRGPLPSSGAGRYLPRQSRSRSSAGWSERASRPLDWRKTSRDRHSVSGDASVLHSTTLRSDSRTPSTMRRVHRQ